ncbi:MAG TPA: hypothetical protein VM912_01780, partial [Terriglobales bacterium]|nr:hypothetical protein [Terriglobales bacterium]
AIATVYILRLPGVYWKSILRTAIIFGLLTGSMEVINISIENGIPFNAHGAAMPISFMLLVFIFWGVAGFRTARSLRSIRGGLLAAILSAGICMLIAIAAGFLVQFVLSPPASAVVSDWVEFNRSGWTDAHAFAIANTFDSGFTHLVMAPLVGLVFGGAGSVMAQLGSYGASGITDQSLS